MEQQGQRDVLKTLPDMKRSDSGYLKKRFQSMQIKGLDKVKRDKIYGTKEQI